MTSNGRKSQSIEESATLFAEFFQSVYSQAPQPVNEAYLNSISENVVHLPQLHISASDVGRRLQSLDVRKSPGPDGLPPSFLKNCASSLTMPLALLFNKSLATGIFPSEWKKASITPIHKSGNIHDVQNYRPISILSCLGKILESFVCDALFDAVEPFITESQHGFVNKRSTTTNLMQFVNDVTRRMEKRQNIHAIYVDFAKAFDRVPHSLATEKLHRMGVPSWVTCWLLSYLTQRRAYVKLNKSRSPWIDLPSGVPQGSHLGPLIFVLFINDLADHISSDKLFYADDLKFYRTINNEFDTYLLQQDINALLRWCNLNGMEVNVAKCKLIQFGRINSISRSNYCMGTVQLQQVNTIKDLGVHLDEKLTFRYHIDITTAKAFGMLGFIKRHASEFRDVYTLKTLYCALVRSVLEYAVQVWAPYHRTHIDRVERIQRNFIRYALRHLRWADPLRLPPYVNRCMLINLETLENRRRLLKRMFLFKILNNEISCSLLLEQINFHVPVRRLRNQVLLWMPYHRTSYGQNEPFQSCCRLFNDVSHLFDFGMSSNSFKNRIRNVI